MTSFEEKFQTIIEKDGYTIPNSLVAKIKQDCMRKNKDQRPPVIRICYLCGSSDNVIRETLPLLYTKSCKTTYGFGHTCSSC